MASITAANSNFDSLEADLRSNDTAWTLESTSASVLVVAIVFINAADFRGDVGGGDFKVHWQIYLRLLTCFCAGTFGAFMLPRAGREYLIWPGMLGLAYLILNAISVPFSVNPSYSLAAWVSLVGVVLFIPAAIHTLGKRRFLLSIFAGLCIYLVGSWIAYLFFPEIGVFHEQITQDDVFVRMGGLAHPNELGFYSAMTILLAAGLGMCRQLRPVVVMCVIALGAATLLTCFSRTAMVGTAVGLTVLWRNHLLNRGNSVVLTTLAAVFFLGIFVALSSGKLDWQVAELVTKLTKSGSTDELATATGRTEIWSYAISIIQESPLVGYGYCSARFVMEDYSYHGHNVVLNAMLYSGVLSGITVAAMILVMLRGILLMPRPEIDGIAACIILSGMLDGVIGAPSPAAGFTLWFTLLLWRQMTTAFEPPESATEFA